MGKGCSLCVVMPMMCDSNGCLWNLHGEGGGVVLFGRAMKSHRRVSFTPIF